jgi:hypothetical protein
MDIDIWPAGLPLTQNTLGTFREVLAHVIALHYAVHSLLIDGDRSICHWRTFGGLIHLHLAGPRVAAVSSIDPETGEVGPRLSHTATTEPSTSSRRLSHVCSQGAEGTAPPRDCGEGLSLLAQPVTAAR